MPDIRFVVYDPPQDGYPFLAVALSPTEVSAVAYDTREEAEAHNAARATEAARAKPDDHAAEQRARFPEAGAKRMRYES